MVQFWLDYLPDLFNPDNFSFLNKDPKKESYIKILNLVSLLVIIAGLTLTFVKKQSFYFVINTLSIKSKDFIDNESKNLSITIKSMNIFTINMFISITIIRIMPFSTTSITLIIRFIIN